jgi:hypothetical protein
MLLMFSVVVPLFWSVTVARGTTNRTLLRLIPILHGRMCHLGGPVVFLLRLLFFARFALSGAEARTGPTKTALVQRTYRPKGGPQEITVGLQPDTPEGRKPLYDYCTTR